MTDGGCKVNQTMRRLDDIISSGRLTNAWCRQRAQELLKLAEDISWGRAGENHLPVMKSLARAMIDKNASDACTETGRFVAEALEQNAEAFISHIETRNCPAGECALLTPAPCQMACPAGIDVPSYITLIGQGRDADAIDLIRKDNPLPWVCGLVCTNPCEFMCVRGRIDEPISIKFLKGFAAERAMSEMRYKNPEKSPDNGRKVCILGAGPAGLTAAYYLALKGYRVRVIEGLPMAGGMMMVGIPRYRLPREVIDREVSRIEDLGVEFRYNTYLGQDVTIESLREEGFEAFLIAMGAHSCLSLKIPGERDYQPVLAAITLLRDVALGERHMPGKRVAVVGGGNVAIDAARTCLRLGCEEVHIIYRRTRSEMPANIEEVEQAEEEGIHFSFLTMPVGVEGDDQGRVRGLRCLRTELGPPDDGGRRRPTPIEGSEYLLEVDAIVSAIGQAVHPGGLTRMEDLKWSRRGTIMVDTASMTTSSDGVFAAGDIVTGPATVVEAIGGGKKAADAIDRYLNGLPQPVMPPVPVRRARLDCLDVGASTKMILKRPHQQMLNLDRRRVTFQQVELGYTENEVREEARRCLRCDICGRCGACMSVCRDMMKIDALKFGYLDFDEQNETDYRQTAERCITCGACAANCPTGAMQVKDIDGERTLSLCGTVLNRLKLEHCRECGAAIGPARYLDYISNKVSGVGAGKRDALFCVNCARKNAAEKQAEITIASGSGERGHPSDGGKS